MFQTPSYNQLIRLCVLFSACGISACGSGSTPENSIPDVEIVAGPVPMSGTIVVEERNGKTVLDGWFVQSMVTGSFLSDDVVSTADDHCEIHSVDVNSVVASSGNDHNDWSDLKSINGTASIDSRIGEFESLIKQSAGNTTVYAPSERWQSDALPDDSVLSFNAESFFGQMDAVDVPALTPLVWTTPATGIMSSAAEPLRWEATLDDNSRINVKLSAIDFRSSDNPAITTIECDLVDDGEFNLSADLQQQLSKDETGIVVYAVRERVQQIQNDDSMLTVVQLSYPAPI